MKCRTSRNDLDALPLATPLLAGLPGGPRVRAIEPRQTVAPHVEVAQGARGSLHENKREANRTYPERHTSVIRDEGDAERLLPPEGGAARRGCAGRPRVPSRE